MEETAVKTRRIICVVRCQEVMAIACLHTGPCKVSIAIMSICYTNRLVINTIYTFQSYIFALGTLIINYSAIVILQTVSISLFQHYNNCT